MAKIERLTYEAAETALPELCQLLIDAVEHGASVSFLLPFNESQAQDYWMKVLAELTAGERILLITRDKTGIIGSVQLALTSTPNGIHRAEVQKLLVHSRARRQGLGTALMQAAEKAAREARRSLIILDTQRGSDAARLYERLGYRRGGIIPDYAYSPDGLLHDTIIYYKRM